MRAIAKIPRAYFYSTRRSKGVGESYVGVPRDSEGSHENFTDRFHTGARVLRSTVLRRESLWFIDFTILIASFPDDHDDNSLLYGQTRPNIVPS